jgi:hypothetical protein
VSLPLSNISSWSGGGGSPQQITADSNYPFAGRQFGGGTRSTIRGTRAFGSGYPYGVTDNSTIAGRPFPYGVWPIYWGNNITGSDEYGPGLDPIRPGGPLVIQAIVNSTSNETYYHITDRDTALAIMTSFVTWCHVTPAWPTIYEPGNSTNTIGIENVIQYYRASSYALAVEAYNNTRALNSSTDTSNADFDPLPDFVTNSTFRQCLDGVIANALPIIDGNLKHSYLGLILGRIFGILGYPILVVLWSVWQKIGHYFSN